MKDPDTMYDAVSEAVSESMEAFEDLDISEREAIAEIRQEKILSQMRKWFECGEYLTVEVDTEADTCVVVPNG